LQLPNATPARFTYYFDHNALKDAVLRSNSLLALTESGNLIRFDAATFAMSGQAIVPGRGTAIAVDQSNRVLVGTQSGQIFEVDSSHLTFKHLVSTSGAILWLGANHSVNQQPETIVAVVNNASDVWPWPGERDKDYDARAAAIERQRFNPHFVLTSTNGRIQSFPLTRGQSLSLPNAFLSDRSGRLWMGNDNGEWGGSCAYMDLRTGRVHSVGLNVGGVLGFLESSDGRIFVYGGTSHMGMNRGYIALAKGEGLKTVREFASDPWPQPLPEQALPVIHESKEWSENLKRQIVLDQNTPGGPVDLVIDDAPGSGFWVVSAHTLYHADSDFSNWKKLSQIGGRWHGGRKFSVGDTPTVNRLIADAPRPGELAAVMGRDGLARISGGTVEHHTFGDQIESHTIHIWNTSFGTVFLGDDSDHPAWRLMDGGWQSMSLFPAREPNPDGASWYFAEPIGNDGSAIAAFTAGNVSPGERDIVQLNAQGSAQLLANSSDSASEWDTSFLVTSQHKLLKITGGRLFIRDDDHWNNAGRSNLDDASERKQGLDGRRFVLLGETLNGDLFLDASLGDLVELAHAKDGGSYRLSTLKSGSGKVPTAVYDAVPDGRRWLLLATAHELLQFRPADGARRHIRKPASDDEIKSLCRDGEGTLWAVGDRLYDSYDDGRHWHTVDLPMLSKTYIKRLRVDPLNPRRLVLTLHDQGVVFIEW
jgi:hypothetical protein